MHHLCCVCHFVFQFALQNVYVELLQKGVNKRNIIRAFKKNLHSLCCLPTLSFEFMVSTSTLLTKKTQNKAQQAALKALLI